MARLGGTNARDIRMLMEGKYPPEVVKAVAGLAERQDHLFQLLGQLAQALDGIADTLLVHTRAVDSLKTEHEKIKQAKSMGVTVASEAAHGNDD